VNLSDVITVDVPMSKMCVMWKISVQNLFMLNSFCSIFLD
jgi:hypothetical protein